MKKSVVIILVVLALVLLLSPGIIGHVADNALNENLVFATDETQEFVLESSTFERGWFTSNGQQRIGVRNGAVQSALLGMAGRSSDGWLPVLVIDTRLDHGLVPVASLGRDNGTLAPGLGNGVSTLALEVGDDTVPLPVTVYSHVNLAGGLQSRALVESSRAMIEDNEYTWESADLTFFANATAEHLGVRGTIGTVAIDNPFESVIIGPVTLDIDQRQLDYGLLGGTTTVAFESLSIIDPNEAITLGATSLSGRLEAAGDRVDIETAISVGDLPTGRWGNADVELDVEIRGVDPESLAQLQQDEMQLGVGEGLLSLNGPARTLLARGFELEMERATFDFDDGQLSADLLLTVEPSDPNRFSIGDLLLNATGSANIRIPAVMVEAAARQDDNIRAMVGFGYLKSAGDYYVTEASLKDGVLTVNGAPTPLGGFVTQ